MKTSITCKRIGQNRIRIAEIFKKWKDQIGEYLICTQDDLRPPLLALGHKCWLEQLLALFKKYQEEYVAISLRTQRIRRRDVDESLELIPSIPSLSSCFRIQKKDDMESVGAFGSRPHWESTNFKERTQPLKKKIAVATHLYCDDMGFMVDNKGYAEEEKDYKTYSPERVKQGEIQPYPHIDEETCIPMKVNDPRDMAEHNKRLAFWELYGFKKSAVMLEGLRERHGERKHEFIQMGPFVNFLYTLARDHENVGTIVEIGTANGVSTNAFLYGLHDRHKSPQKRKLYSIDINDCKEWADVDVDIKENWEFIQADSNKMKWDKGTIDILLIDGAHSYREVLTDYRHFEPFVREGGLILFHDVLWPQKSPRKVFWEEVKYPKIILPLGPSGMGVITKIFPPYFKNPELIDLEIV